MGQILIIGGGTAGTIMANRLARKLDPKHWSITVLDPEPRHYYQPGFLFIPFGVYGEKDVSKPKAGFFPSGVKLIQAEAELIEPKLNRVLVRGLGAMSYDYLVIASGCGTAPAETEGLLDGGWRKNIFDFYTLEGSLALAKHLTTWRAGRLVVHIAEMPIKCPVAPLEFVFLADAWFRAKGLRKQVQITYATPLAGAFTKATCARVLGSVLEERDIRLEPNFDVERVDPLNNRILSYDGRVLDYDLLVSVPTNMGDPLMERSGLGDELNFIPTDPKTLRSKDFENIFVIGDAASLPASKAGATAHFEGEVLAENILRATQGKSLKEGFDGHVNCFIESGAGKAFLIDFNYLQEPLPGKFPLPGLGPLSLLKETRLNHLGKMAFKWIYWNLLLKGRPLPLIRNQFSMRGKRAA